MPNHSSSNQTVLPAFFQELPKELVFLIANQATQPTLFSLCLVSKSFLSFSRPTLYVHPILPTRSHIQKFHASLVKNRSLQFLVKGVKMMARDEEITLGLTIAATDVILACKKLDRVEITFTMDIEPGLWTSVRSRDLSHLSMEYDVSIPIPQILTSFPRLQSLQITFYGSDDPMETQAGSKDCLPLPSLKKISLVRTNLEPTDLRWLFDHSPNLTSFTLLIHFDTSPIVLDDIIAAFIAAPPTLKEVELRSSRNAFPTERPEVADGFLDSLFRHCPSIEFLITDDIFLNPSVLDSYGHRLSRFRVWCSSLQALKDGQTLGLQRWVGGGGGHHTQSQVGGMVERLSQCSGFFQSRAVGSLLSTMAMAKTVFPNLKLLEIVDTGDEGGNGRAGESGNGGFGYSNHQQNRSYRNNHGVPANNNNNNRDDYGSDKQRVWSEFDRAGMEALARNARIPVEWLTSGQAERMGGFY